MSPESQDLRESSAEESLHGTAPQVEELLVGVREFFASSHADGLKELGEQALGAVNEQIGRDPLRVLVTAFLLGAGISRIGKAEISQFVSSLFGKILHGSSPSQNIH